MNQNHKIEPAHIFKHELFIFIIIIEMVQLLHFSKVEKKVFHFKI